MSEVRNTRWTFGLWVTALSATSPQPRTRTTSACTKHRQVGGELKRFELSIVCIVDARVERSQSTGAHIRDRPASRSA
jgi:hypothetical protein